MSTAYADRLIESVRVKATPLCIGLDPFADKVPAMFGDLRADPAAVLVKFGTSVIDVAAKHAAVLKPQLGLFEQFGEMGYAAARMLVEYGRAAGMIVLLDAKRGDIGTTADGYARATLGPRPGFDADCVTVNPYMGKDTLVPFVSTAKALGKGVAVLVRTSNPGAGDFQDLQVGGAPVWRRVAEMLAPETQDLMGASGWSGLMAVAGATYPDEARTLREAMPNALFLVPGYGAQGASAADAVAGFVATKQGLEGGVVSSSRAVTYPAAAQTAKNMGEWRAAIEEAMQAAAAELRTACNR
ncbi:orotidine-5'-phosphate decarboxylase [Terricaulis sp.]|uniref:orotidine-5'-phosphate decarboxylase n=1 Tax=Terricaulis sp. TaxID=2768686 RepID=UPI002AC7BC61|nr:orotidine-5'-phosphate decarboxylase [Terricaulis sp.]MDZ4691274.1 orotidine-5'-phosphate decarboxylase [Terricaulis sp.]